MSVGNSIQRGPVEKEPYYHGFLPREDVKTVLKNQGEFLVRITEPRKGEPRSYVLSVMHNLPTITDEEAWVKHYVIKSQGGKYYIEKNTFSSIQEMIEHHLKTKDTVKDDVCLLKALPRQTWELDHEKIDVLRKLGEGAFGEVMMGKLRFRTRGSKSVNVAIKQAKLSNLTKEQIKEFMGEARVMRLFFHPHVVRFYGVAATTEPLYMVMELASNGALDSYLKKNELTLDKKTEMILQASWGLEYLHSKPVIHRDIAARNCLYGDDRVKISDFGLTRHGTTYQADPNKKAPIRWLATEVIRQRLFSLKTDAWAYAVMSWEIYNNGIEPYPGMMVAEVAQRVIEGYRMELPDDLNPEIKTLIGRCWADGENDRPSMADVSTELQRITGTVRPDFARLEVQMKKELQQMNNIGDKSATRKNKPSKSRVPKGM